MPALWAALALATGIGIGAATPQLHPELFWICALKAALGLVLSYLGYRLWPHLSWIGIPLWSSLALLLLSAGALRYRSFTDVSACDIGLLASAYGSVEVALEGTVVADPDTTRAGLLRFRLKAERLRFPLDTFVTGYVQVRLAARPSGAWPQLAAGDRLALEGLLEVPPSGRNPGGFDLRAHLARQRVHAVLFVRHAGDLVQLGSHRSPPEALLQGVRRWIRGAFCAHVPESARGILLAIWLGDRRELDEELEEAFARAGTLHLLAVSGMNVALLAWLVYLVVGAYTGRRPERRPLRAALVIGAVLLYAAVTGAQPSIVRAAIMTAVVLLAECLERPWTGLNTLGVAALLSLWWRPTDLWDPSWQLSFSAMLGLVHLTPLLQTWTRRDRWAVWARPLGDMVWTSLAAQLTTAPVLVAHFGQLSWVGPVSNLVAIPATWIAFGAGAGVIAGAALPWSEPAHWAGALSAWGVAALEHSSRWAASWPFASSFYHPENGFLWAAIALAVLAVLMAHRSRWAWRLLCAAGLAYAVGRATVLIRGPELQVAFLDVGQGDATVVRTPGGRTLVFDAGPKTDTWDAGRRVLLPVLRRWNVRGLDVLLLSHAHVDHTGGRAALEAALPVRRLLGPEARSFWGAGDTLHVEPGLRLYLLHPAPEDSLLAENDRSFVLLLQYGRTRFLWAGDLEREGENRLLERWGNFLRVDVVKAPHHGGQSSSQTAFIRATRPSWVVISAGRRNPFGHPHPEVLARWRAAGARIWRTDAQGAALFASDGRRVRLISR